MKNVVITGANRGIGLELVRLFNQKNYRVHALCRQSSAELDALNVHVYENIDVSTEQGLNKMVSDLSDIAVDILICNAGILRDESLGHLNNLTIKQQFETNALAPLNIVDKLHKQLQSTGKVALITSRMGSIADNSSGGRYGYRMSKAALNAAGMSLSHDLADKKIAVGIYHPGYVQTDMVNNRGDISAGEAANRLVNLIENLSMNETGVFKHSNGQVLPW